MDQHSNLGLVDQNSLKLEQSDDNDFENKK